MTAIPPVVPPSNTKLPTAGVKLADALRVAAFYDTDRNGILDRTEISQAAMGAFNNNREDLGSLFAGFLQGGVNKGGLLPDFNKDNFLDAQELRQLAAGGKSDTLENSDFKFAFGTNYSETGNVVNKNQLAIWAKGWGVPSTDPVNVPVLPPTVGPGIGWVDGLNPTPTPKPPTPTPNTDNLSQLLMMLLTQLMSGMNTQPTYPPQPAPVSRPTPFPTYPPQPITSNPYAAPAAGGNTQSPNILALLTQLLGR